MPTINVLYTVIFASSWLRKMNDMLPQSPLQTVINGTRDASGQPVHLSRAHYEK